MAPDAPDVGAAPRRRWPRGWHNYDNYRVTHDNHMDALVEEGVVVRDTLTFRENRDAAGRLVEVNLRGRIETANGGVLVVNKWLDVRHAPRAEVRTHEYAYHAFVRAAPRRRDLFRYDNCHGGLETLHRHAFGPDGNPTGIEPVAHDELPPLDQIIRETEEAAAAALGGLA